MFGFIIWLLCLGGFLWGLVTLHDLMNGQAEVLQRLKRIEDALQTQANVVNGNDDR